jgi:hypothetical protein
MNLFIASLRFKQPIWKLCYAVLPFLAIRVGFLLLITFVEDISLVLVRHPSGVLWILTLFPAVFVYAIFRGEVKFHAPAKVDN